MRKSSFLTFCFAFIPGAGEMYLGMMRKGVFIMSLFWGVIGISTFLQMGFICVVLPIIWFYSFFETFNIKHLSSDEIEFRDQEFAEQLGKRVFTGDLRKIFSKRHAAVGWALVAVGGWAFINSFVFPILEEFFNFHDFWIYRYLSYRLPSILVAVLIILLGIHLIRGKKKVADDADGEYGGDRHE